MLRFALAAYAMIAIGGHAAEAANTDAINAVKAGQHGCPNCILAGANLSNQCLQGSDFQGTDFDNARLVLTCLSHTDMRNATFRRADLSGANLFEANLDGADLSGATLSITSIKGADLAHAKGLTQKQVDAACGDAQTKLPPGLSVKVCQ